MFSGGAVDGRTIQYVGYAVLGLERHVWQNGGKYRIGSENEF